MLKTKSHKWCLENRFVIKWPLVTSLGTLCMWKDAIAHLGAFTIVSL